MAPRSRDEHHRAATQLELLFDLAMVIAIASAAHGLHHAISDAHATEGIIAFGCSFFAIWWSWMNYTWFASAYDDGSPWFRFLTLWIILGALFVAAGIPALFSAKPFFLVWLGFLIMRLGQVALWLTAARGDPAHRTTALRYAAGIAACQVYWTLLFMYGTAGSAQLNVLYLIGMVCELSVPMIAEHAGNTPWHRHHIIERYGLLNIIVLGECMLASANALRRADMQLSLSSPLLHIAVSAAVMTFAMWWVYFLRDEHLETHDHRRAFVWGYGHILLFAAGAATGAGFGVLTDIVAGKAKVGLRIGDIAVAVPVALYFVTLWFVRDRFLNGDWRRHALLVGAVLIVAVGVFLPAPLELMTIVAVGAVVVRCGFSRQRIEV